MKVNQMTTQIDCEECSSIMERVYRCMGNRRCEVMCRGKTILPNITREVYVNFRAGRVTLK